MIADATHGHAPTDLFIVATMTNEGVSCPAVRTDDGILYTLTGLTDVPEVGQRLEIVGEALRFSKCQQGQTLRVKTLKPIDDD